MKRSSIFLGLAACLVFGSCTKQLELEDPQGLSPETALATDGNIKRVLQGAYDAISSSSLYGGDLQLMADLMGSNGELSWKGTFNNYREIWGKSIITTNSLITSTWLDAYSAINVSNNIITNIDKVTTTADASRVKGEALFIRAAMHFELVRFYAKDYMDGDAAVNLGVPVVTTPTNSTEEIAKPARSTVRVVYDAVIADLTEAENLLPKTNGVFATKSAAAAMLSRVYLQKGDYAGARDAANRGIANATGKSLLANVADNFNQAVNTSEDLFAIQVSDQDGANNMQVFYSVPDFGARDGDIEVTPTHLKIYEATDDRATVTDEPEDANFSTGFYFIYDAYRSTKFRDLYKNVKVIRLAELYLTRAEANYRLGTAVGSSAVNDINLIRKRAGLNPVASLASVDAIYLERHRELAFEGFALHDLKRFKRTIDGRPWNDNSLVFPIPFREINANGSLDQNPGY